MTAENAIVSRPIRRRPAPIARVGGPMAALALARRYWYCELFAVRIALDDAATGPPPPTGLHWRPLAAGRMTLRRVLTVLHRWAGLSLALFLAIAGLTGAALAYRAPLEAWLAPEFHVAPGRGRPLDPLILRARAEALTGGAVDFLPLDVTAGKTLVLGVDGADFDEIALDPVTGAELGRRRWGDISEGRINLLPFLYRLHYSVAAGDAGVTLMGIVALVWSLDCLVGLALTLPRGRQRWWLRWRKAFGLSTASTPRLVFDSHRAAGLWLWPILLLFAWSSVGFNLPKAFSPLMTAVVADVQDIPIRPAIRGPVDWPAARARGQAALQAMAAREAITNVRGEWLRLNRSGGQWIIGFRSSRDLATAYAGGRLILDGAGRELAVRLPTGQNRRQTVESVLFGLHMGGVLGPLWRAALVLIGLGIAALAVTGVLIWWRKRRAPARRQGAARPAGAPRQISA